MSEQHPAELLSAYLDGEVTSAEQAEVARHLETCGECRWLLDDFRAMATAAAQEAPPPLPAGTAARIVAALRARAPRERRRFAHRWPLPLAVAAGLVVVVSGTWVLVRRQTERQRVIVSQAVPDDRSSDQRARDDSAGRRREEETPASGSESGASGRAAASHAQIPAEAMPERNAAPAPSPPRLSPASREPGGETPPAAALAVPDAAARASGLPAPPEPAGGRSILFEYDGARGTLTEAGLVTLVLDQVSCSIDLSAAPAAGDEVRSIFRLAPEVTASSPPQRSAAPAEEAPESVRFRELERGRPSGMAQERKVARSIRLIRVLSPEPLPLTAADAGRVEEGLRRLLNGSVRELIEARCGVPPARGPSGD